MVIVFGAFALGRTGTVQQLGLGLAVAVAVDATIVRCVLVPATMTLLGRWNWWAPAALRRLPRRAGFREPGWAGGAIRAGGAVPASRTPADAAEPPESAEPPTSAPQPALR